MKEPRFVNVQTGAVTYTIYIRDDASNLEVYSTLMERLSGYKARVLLTALREFDKEGTKTRR